MSADEDVPPLDDMSEQVSAARSSRSGFGSQQSAGASSVLYGFDKEKLEPIVGSERRPVAQRGDADLGGGRVRWHPGNVDATALVVVERSKDAVPHASQLAPAAASSELSRLEDFENG